MTKLLKITGLLLSGILLTAIVGAILLVTFVSPNRLKPLITDQVMKETGRQLVIDGDLSWSFFPYLGVKVGHMQLSNPSAFQQKTFAEIQNATVGVKLMPLWHKQIESSGVTLHGLTLHLIKNAKGEVNWNFKSGTTDTNASQSSPTQTEKASMGLAVSGVDVTDATITFTDEQAKKSYDFKHVDLHAKNITLTKSFPVKMKADFSANNPAASGHVTFSSNVKLNVDAQLFSFNQLDFAATVNQAGKETKFILTGNVVANLAQQTLQWTDFQGNVNNLVFTGKVNANHILSSPVARGHFAIQRLDADKIKLTDVNVDVHFQNNIVDVSSLTANLYQGTLKGQVKVNLATPTPQIALQVKVANIEAEPLLRDVRGADQKLTVTGAGNIDLQITTSGADSKTILQNLNGVSRYNFENGALVGVDLGYLVDSAYALVKKKPAPTQNENKTNFGNLTGTATINHGVITSNDMLLDSPRFSTRGKGYIDLVNQAINYQLLTVVKQRSTDEKNDLQNLYGISLPVLIAGSLDNPHVRLDTMALVKAATEQQVEKVTDKVQEKIQEQIKKKLPGQAGEMLNQLLGH